MDCYLVFTLSLFLSNKFLKGFQLSVIIFCRSRFECFEGTQCLHITQKCDGHLDCWDGSDEKYCIGKSQCGKPFQFHCQPGSDSVCVDAEKMCDGQFDCPQGYDEKVRLLLQSNRAFTGDFLISLGG